MAEEEQIYYIRLISGEELLCTVPHTTDGGNMIAADPMLIESATDDNGNHMIFLSRFAPYAKDKSVPIPKIQTLLIMSASDVMGEYYARSLDFCRLYIDKRMNSGLVKAIEYVESAITNLSKPQSMVDQLIDEENDGLAEDGEEETDEEMLVSALNNLMHRTTYH